MRSTFSLRFFVTDGDPDVLRVAERSNSLGSWSDSGASTPQHAPELPA